MIIGCPRCQTSWVLPDAAVPRAGAPVQCTRCGFISVARPGRPRGAPALVEVSCPHCRASSYLEPGLLGPTQPPVPCQFCGMPTGWLIPSAGPAVVRLGAEAAVPMPGRAALPRGERPRSFEVNRELEALITGAPDDELHWRIYADWLLERDSALGHWLANRGGPAPDLGDAARFLDVTWGSGLVTRAVVRRREAYSEQCLLNDALQALLDTPACRFVTELELDVRSLVGAQVQSPLEVACLAIEELARDPLPRLRSLRLGPLSHQLAPPGAERADLKRAFETLRTACPALATAWQALVWVPERAFVDLRLVNTLRASRREGEEELLRAGLPFSLYRPPLTVAYRRIASWEVFGWQLEVTHSRDMVGPLAPRVNDRLHRIAHLRDGDRVMVPGTAEFIFRER